MGAYGVTDTDVWGHLRFGLDILEDRHIPDTDGYSFTTTQRWINHEWLSQVLFALSYRLGGLPLLTTYRAAIVALLVWLLYLALRQTTWPLRDGLLLATLLAASSLTRSVRPQIHSLPLYALTLIGLSRDAAWLPAVFVVWANLHGGWMLGLGAVAVRALCQPSARRLGLLGACALATLLNPYGLALWGSLREALTRGWSNVTEWQPITAWSLGIDQAVVWLAVVGLIGWSIRRHRPTLFASLWTLAVAVAAFRSRRLVPFFGLTATMLMAAPIPGPAPTLTDNRWTRQTAATVAVAVLVCTLVATLFVYPTATCLPPTPEPMVRPESAAVRFIRSADLHGRVLMWFDWGLYAIWQVGDRFRVSMDNRRETVYSDRVVQEHGAFYRGDDPEYPERIGADYVWLPASLPPVAQLQQRGWFTVFRGPRSAILSRTFRPEVVIGSEDSTNACFPQP